MKVEKQKDSDIVYSTEYGRMCPACGRAVADCLCRGKGAAPPGDGVVRVGRETKGRRGKTVTIISGVPLGLQGLSNLEKQIKQKCGAGGTVRNGVIEIQGDHRDLLVEELKRLGYKVKRSG